MKAILTLNEMPANCEECPLNYDMYTCLFITNSSTILMDSERLDDCPLKELPEPRKNWHAADWDINSLPVEYKFVSQYMTGFEDGWNACLNEICGTED